MMIDDDPIKDLTRRIKQSDKYGVDRWSRDMGTMFAHNHEDFRVRQLHLSWAIDSWAAEELTEYIPAIDKCYDALKSLNKKFIYNDLDNSSKILKWKNNARAFTVTDQNRNYVFVREVKDLIPDFPSLTIYRYWERPSKKRWLNDEINLTTLQKEGQTKYNDSRDSGWIASLGFLGHPGRDMIGNYYEFIHALLDIDCLVAELDIELD